MNKTAHELTLKLYLMLNEESKIEDIEKELEKIIDKQNEEKDEEIERIENNIKDMLKEIKIRNKINEIQKGEK
jgi:hypothetical protein